MFSKFRTRQRLLGHDFSMDRFLQRFPLKLGGFKSSIVLKSFCGARVEYAHTPMPVVIIRLFDYTPTRNSLSN